MSAMRCIQANDPSSFIARAASTKAASASRLSAPPTLMRLAPAAATSATVMPGSSQPVTTFSGRSTASTTARISAAVLRPGA